MPRKRKAQSIMLATILTLAFAAVLSIASIPTTTILPTAAPIWVGIALMSQS
jgi:hypothetical protein